MRGSFLYTGDTRPIPEVVGSFATAGEPIFHDCAVRGSPAHTGLEDVLREYPEEVRGRMVAYHYESETAAQALEQAGLRVARVDESFALPRPISSQP